MLAEIEPATPSSIEPLHGYTSFEKELVSPLVAQRSPQDAEGPASGSHSGDLIWFVDFEPAIVGS